MKNEVRKDRASLSLLNGPKLAASLSSIGSGELAGAFHSVLGHGRRRNHFSHRTVRQCWETRNHPIDSITPEVTINRKCDLICDGQKVKVTILITLPSYLNIPCRFSSIHFLIKNTS